MTKQYYNFEVLIRGQMLAYSPDEITDVFKDNACYDFMQHSMGFQHKNYDGRIKVSVSDDIKPDIGYYDANTYEYVVKKVAYKIYMQKIKGTLMDMKERIKVYDQAINALNDAKVGIFGDAQQIKLTYNGLITYRELLQDMVDKCEHDLKYIKYYEDIPKGDEPSIEMAKEVLMQLNDFFIIQEPKESDTVVNVEKGNVK
jgi:hypothetical protein